MKILILTRHFYPIDRPSGVVSLVREYVSALTKAKHEVCVACVKHSDEQNSYRDNSGLQIYKFHKLMPTGLRKINTEFSPDRIIIFSSISRGTLLLLWWYVNCLIAGTYKKTSFYQTTNLELSPGEKSVFKALLKPFRSVLCANKPIMDEIGLVESDRNLILPGVDIQSIKKAAALKSTNHTDNSKFAVCFMGHLSHVKGADIVVELAQSMPQIQFNLIAGYSPGAQNQNFYARIKARIETTENIQHYGYTDNPIALLSANNLLVLPYRSGTTVLGVAQSAIEAMALGIPVLSSKNTAVSEILIDGYNGYHAETVEEFKQHILELIRRSDHYGSLSENAKRTAQEAFNIHRQAERILNLED